MGHFSFWTLFLQADIIVKSVIIILIGSSIWTWSVIIQKSFFLWKKNQKADVILQSFHNPKQGLEPQLHDEENVFLDMIFLMEKEAKRLIQTQDLESYQWNLDRFEQKTTLLIDKEKVKASDYMASLSVIGSLSPFVGLLGTVWGIMSCFQAIGSSKSASLAVVGPGIAEALLTTAIGLIVAIVSVLFYSYFQEKINAYELKMDTFAQELVLAAGSGK